jgi:hypothetical protein
MKERRRNVHDRRRLVRRVEEIPDPAEHPVLFRWVTFRWRLGLAISTHPVVVALIVALAVCAFPLYSILDQQGILREQQQKLQVYAKSNREQIRELRALQGRVGHIEHPTPAELRAAIARALIRCSHDSKCRLLFGRLTREARRELRKQIARDTGKGTAPGGASRGSTGEPSSPGRTTSPRSSSPRTPSRAPGGGSTFVPSPTPTPPAPRPSPRPPNIQTPVTPIPLPPICTPVVGVNCR